MGEIGSILATVDSELGAERRPDKEKQEPPAGGSEKKEKRARMVVKDVDADPPQRRKLLFLEAHRLATMPRGRFEDSTKAAFWSAIATGAGAYSGITDIFTATPQAKALDLIEIGIFAICVAIAGYGAFVLRPQQTADQYLNELYSITPKAPGKFARLWHEWFG